jgi:hypothetical protein
LIIIGVVFWVADNGQAIWGGCVTRCSIRAVPSTRDGTLAGKLSRRAPRERSEQRGCKEGMARVFAVQVQNWLNITRIAVQSKLQAGFCHHAG